MITSAIKKQTSICCFIKSLYGISNLESRKKKRKRKAILLLAYIADVSCLTNRFFYMRTLSLTNNASKFKKSLLRLMIKLINCYFFRCKFLAVELVRVEFS